jgi:uncharacterized protein
LFLEKKKNITHLQRTSKRSTIMSSILNEATTSKSTNLKKIYTAKTNRLDVIDALRGFAVMAILLVHSVEHFIFPVYPNQQNYPQWLHILDKGVFDVVFALFAGKAYAIFALLFGLTFYIQQTSQQLKGKDFGYRFLWRLLLLVGFATINAAFFPGGDVLLLYAAVAVVLFIVRKWSDKAVLITALFFLLQPVEWFHFIVSLTNPNYSLPDLGVGALYEQIGLYTKEGDFWNFILGNITTGQKASLLWAVGAGRFLQTAGLFMIGMLIGRKQYFITSETNTQFWTKILIVSAVLFCPLYALKVQVYDNASSNMIKQTVGVIFDMWQKSSFTFVLVSSFVLLYQSEKFKKLTSNLRLYGKMSLTNYITQSIVGAFIYFPFGLYLAPYCGYTVSLLIGIAIFFLQVFLCKWWLAKYSQGPFERIWYKLTWMKFK